ncbi:hypothetical protein [Streptomyces sp. 8L]|uniref:hypothetical protein n=1 Tax=unclassified Streptomyces TaxID=2593676 RepID=UPI001CD1E88F|nr:hypothetical protein [Streptomyces sp. 8L]MCA1222459.1 hypothetical protein [Streptomyces sp. 8L]
MNDNFTTRAHDEGAKRGGEAVETYTYSGVTAGGQSWRSSPGETLTRLLADLLHWADDTQRDFDKALERARKLHDTEL